MSLSKVVPNGFDGLVKIKPLTLMFDFWAFSYASFTAFVVIWKLLELSQGIGMSCTPVLHLKSRLNLH